MIHKWNSATNVIQIQYLESYQTVEKDLVKKIKEISALSSWKTSSQTWDESLYLSRFALIHSILQVTENKREIFSQKNEKYIIEVN